MHLNIALLIFSFLGAPFIVDNLADAGGDWSAPGFKVILQLIGFTAFGTTIVLGLGQFSKNVNTSIFPSISRSPIIFSAPIQIFYIGSLSFISAGLGGFLFALLSTPFRWEWVLLICTGIGTLLGVLINKPKKVENTSQY